LSQWTHDRATRGQRHPQIEYPFLISPWRRLPGRIPSLWKVHQAEIPSRHLSTWEIVKITRKLRYNKIENRLPSLLVFQSVLQPSVNICTYVSISEANQIHFRTRDRKI
jgi:hypothetical protein